MSGDDSGPPPLDGSLKGSLIFAGELLWVLICSVPIFIFTIFKKIFPGEGKDLTGKIVLITGAGNGLGKELSLQLARQKCRIVCVDIKKSDNEETARQIIAETGNSSSAKAYVCDVSNTASVETLRDQVLKDFKNVDILINNAGIIYGNRILTGDIENIKRVVDVNLMSSYWMTRAFLPHMKERKEGHVVFINSMASLTPVGGGSIYCVTKFGLLGLALSLEDDLLRDPSYAGTNIKITSVHPYFIQTADYYTKKLFKSRIGTLETSDAVKQIITGIRREYLTFQVPGLETGYWLTTLLRCLPVPTYRMLRKVLHTDISAPQSDKEYKNIHKKVVD